MQHEIIPDVLEELCRIIHSDTTGYSFDPTPIRPEGVRVVKEVPVTASGLYQDGTFNNLLSSSLVRKRKSEDSMIQVRPTCSCFDDMRANNIAIESDPSDEMLFPDLGGEEHVFPATKRLKTMYQSTTPTCIPLLASSFANIFDQDINMSSEEQAFPEASRRNSITHEDSPSHGKVRFRGYQSIRWSSTFEELNNFHQENGHCQVGWKANPVLAGWIKRQRYQYKLKQEGRRSTMIGERVAALEELGFSWDSNETAWEENFNELVLFKAKHGHCRVPSPGGSFSENPQLSIWVKGQRRQMKLFQSGKISAIDADRTAKLNDLGFCWNLRNAT